MEKGNIEDEKENKTSLHHSAETKAFPGASHTLPGYSICLGENNDTTPYWITHLYQHTLDFTNTDATVTENAE